MNACDLAWAAGLFEGEGCAGLGKGQPHLQLTTTDKDVLERFARVVDVGTMRALPSRYNALGKKPAWRWAVWGADALALAERLYPYLGARRRARIDEIVSHVFAHPRICRRWVAPRLPL